MSFEQDLKNYINGIDGAQSDKLRELLQRYFLAEPIDPNGYMIAINALGVLRHLPSLTNGALPLPEHIAVVCNIISAGTSTFLSSTILGPQQVGCTFPNSDYYELFDSLIQSFLGRAALTRASITNIIGFAPQYYQWLNRVNSASSTGIPIGTATTKIPEYVTSEHMYTLFCNQLGFDVNLLLTAISQRQVIPGPYVVNPYSLRDDLARFDCYANQMVQNAVDAGLFDDRVQAINGFIMTGKNTRGERIREPRPIIITYVSKMPTSRVIPYSPIVLLGLPSDYFLASDVPITKNKRLLSAINHEIGRLAMWRGFCEMTPDIPSDAEAKQKNFNQIRSGGISSFTLKSVKKKALVVLNRYLRMAQFSQWVTDGVEQIMADVFTAMHSDTHSCMSFVFYKTKAMVLERSFYDKLRYQLPIELRAEIFYYIRKRIAPTSSNPSNPTGTTDLDLEDAHNYWWRMGKSPAGYHNQGYGPHVKDSTTGKPVDWGWRAELFGPEVDLGSGKEIHVNPTTIKPYGIEYGLSFESVKEELLEVAEIIFQLLGGKPKSTSGIPPKLSGSSPVTYYFDPSQMSGYWTQTQWEAWANLLIEEEETMRQQYKNSGGIGAYDAYTTDPEELNFYTLLYAGGWIMQSSGNTGSTPP